MVENCVVDMQVQAHIPEEYISGTNVRLDIYRRIADIRTEEDAMDTIDELIDRFGDPPAAVKGLVDIALLRNTAAGLGIDEIKQQSGSLLIYKKEIDMRQISQLVNAMKGRILLSAKGRAYISVRLLKDSPTEMLSKVLKLMQKGGEKAIEN